MLAERNNEDWSIDLYSVERITSKYLALASAESLELTPEMLIGTPQQNEPLWGGKSLNTDASRSLCPP